MKINLTTIKVVPSIVLLASLVSGCGGGVVASSSVATAISSSSQAEISSSIASSAVAVSSIASSSLASSSLPSSPPASSSMMPISSSSIASSSAATIPAGAALVYALNAGGPAVSLGGVAYKADSFSTGGNSHVTPNAIGGVTEDALYQSEHYGETTYEIPVTNATYDLKLHFAEIFQTAAGKRSFNVTVEGEPVIQNLDIFAQAGNFTAHTVIANRIMVADKSLTIKLTSVIDSPTIAGFAIYSSDGGKFVEPPAPVGGVPVPSIGCGKTPTLAFENAPGGFGVGGNVKIQSGGTSRNFAIRLPDNYDKNKAYPLFFGFHWNGGNSKAVDTGGTNGYNMSHFGLQKLSKNGAIFIAPDGLGGGWANTGGRDVKLVDDIIAKIEQEYCVDKSRLFANGFSYGGMMSHALACARADVFRGVAIYDGAELSGCEGGKKPIAYWIMAGLKDTVTTVAMALPMRDRFVTNNGCTKPNQEPPRPPFPEPYLKVGGHVCTDYKNCAEGKPVRWCVHQSGHGNAVVDGTGDLYNQCATAPKTCSASCPCTWVPEDAWKFFNSL